MKRLFGRINDDSEIMHPDIIRVSTCSVETLIIGIDLVNGIKRKHCEVVVHVVDCHTGHVMVIWQAGPKVFGFFVIPCSSFGLQECTAIELRIEKEVQDMVENGVVRL